MVETRTTSMIVQCEFNEVKASIFKCNKYLLLLIEHPLKHAYFSLNLYLLLAEPFPIASDEDQYWFLICDFIDCLNGQKVAI